MYGGNSKILIDALIWLAALLSFGHHFKVVNLKVVSDNDLQLHDAA